MARFYRYTSYYSCCAHFNTCNWSSNFTESQLFKSHFLKILRQVKNLSAFRVLVSGTVRVLVVLCHLISGGVCLICSLF